MNTNNNLFEYVNDPRNDGTSVWVFQGNKHLTWVSSHIRSLPKFYSDRTYCVISCSHTSTVLGDQPFRTFKVYFWIGARSTEYDASFEQISSDTKLLLEESTIRTKARIYVELQYSETTQFFALFKRFNYIPKEQPSLIKQYCCIEYQDFNRETKQRAVAFPKFLVIERATSFFKSTQEYYIRIHEKSKLDHVDGSRLGIVYLEGRHEDDSGNEIKVNAAQYLNERVTSLQYSIGEDCTKDHVNFMRIFAQAYQKKYNLKSIQEVD